MEDPLKILIRYRPQKAGNTTYSGYKLSPSRIRGVSGSSASWPLQWQRTGTGYWYNAVTENAIRKTPGTRPGKYRCRYNFRFLRRWSYSFLGMNPLPDTG